MTVAMCTIVANNYISMARTLVHSYLERYPDGKAFVLVVDENEPDAAAQEAFTVIKLQDMQIPDEKSFCFKYDVLELCTAVKPYLLEYLFKRAGVEKILYFDPDILITGSLAAVYQWLDRYSIVLTPHIMSPIGLDGCKPSEIDILKAGVYNLGFIGVSGGETTNRFLAWWKARLYHHCLAAPEQGLFVDQKWIDLVPYLFGNTYVITEPEYNVAYWNLHERKLTRINGAYEINGRPLAFFHFSGFDVSLKQLSKFQNRHNWKNSPSLLPLYQHYRLLLLSNGYSGSKESKYAYDYFDNGAKIHKFIRTIYYRLGNGMRQFGNPFQISGQNSFYRWLASPVNGDSVIPKVLYELYKAREDLQRAFPDGLGANQRRLMMWAKIALPRDYGIGNEFFRREADESR
ncbi:hypothetical protein AB6A23_20755 [Paenibacillus tarimensis]